MKTLGSPHPSGEPPLLCVILELPKIRGSSPNDVLPFKADVDVEEATLLQDTFFSEDCWGGIFLIPLTYTQLPQRL